MSATGFLPELGREVRERAEQRRAEGLENSKALRERKADELETAIRNIQARGALQPGSPGYLAPDELKQTLSAAQTQLSRLYEPHEGPHLLQRLKRATTQAPAGSAAGTPASSVPGSTPPGTPKTPTLHPGMTLDEVLAASGPAPSAPARTDLEGQVADFKKAWKDATGSDPSPEVMQEFVSKKGGIAGEEEKNKPLKQQYKDAGLSDEDAEKAVRIHFGLAPKSVPAKPVKKPALDTNTDTVTKYNDDGSVSTWARTDPDQPEDVAKLFAGRTGVKKEKEKEATTAFNRRLYAQDHSFKLALDRGDHAAANRYVASAKNDLVQAQSRVETMDQNKKDALAGNQQAMLSMVANHIGMTLGAQKGARITRAVWDEAIQSAPWVDQKISKWFHTDENGDHVFDGYKGGVTLTPDQINQMVGLAHQKVDTLQHQVTHMQTAFDSELKGKGTPTSGGGANAPATTEPELTPDEKKIQELLNK